MKLQDATPGRRVIYTPFVGCDPGQCEEGEITSVNHKYVFVRYGRNTHSKSTRPEDIEYIPLAKMPSFWVKGDAEKP